MAFFGNRTAVNIKLLGVTLCLALAFFMPRANLDVQGQGPAPGQDQGAAQDQVRAQDQARGQDQAETQAQAQTQAQLNQDPTQTLLYEIEVQRTIPHDPTAHMQGLLVYEGKLYESEGREHDDGNGSLVRNSSLRELDPTTGEVLRRLDQSGFWSEGLARVAGRLIQLTYQAGTARAFDLATFEELETYSYEGEGWGLCFDGQRLIRSDGSRQLFFHDPQTFAPTGSVTITYEGQPVQNFNELACVGEHVYANMFPYADNPAAIDHGLGRDHIVRIDMQTAEIDAVIDAGGLLSDVEKEELGVLDFNGIAYDAASDEFYLGGKFWPEIYVVKLVPAKPSQETETPDPTPSPTRTTHPSTTMTPSQTPSITSTPSQTLEPTPAPLVPEVLEYEILSTQPHDPSIYTQGLLIHDDKIYESAGNPNFTDRPSSLRELDLETSEELRISELPDTFYGEGLARVAEELFWITWLDRTAFVFNIETFSQERSYDYVGEGWGLCFDGEDLVMSDGSDELFFRDPENFRITRRVNVTREGVPQGQLNELECVDGAVYANVWKREDIVRIDSKTGEVTGVLDARGLRPATATHNEAVLNGIAWNEADDTFLVTGKLWDVMYKIRIGPPLPPGLYLPYLARDHVIR